MAERNESLRHLFNGPPIGKECFDLVRGADQDLLYLLMAVFLQGIAFGIPGRECGGKLLQATVEAYTAGPKALRRHLLIYIGAPEFDDLREAESAEGKPCD